MSAFHKVLGLRMFRQYSTAKIAAIIPTNIKTRLRLVTKENFCGVFAFLGLSVWLSFLFINYLCQKR